MMSRDLRELLRSSAADPSDDFDVEDLRVRGTRIGRRRHVAVTAAVAAIVVLAAIGTWATVSGRTAPVVVGQPTEAPTDQPGTRTSTPTAPQDREIVNELPEPPIAPRDGHSVVWTGTEMIVWGGSEHIGSPLETYNNGAAYDPDTDTWRELPPSPGTGTTGHVAAWTRSQMLVVGGEGAQQVVELYDPEADAWTVGADAPFAVDRDISGFAWNGMRLAVWTPGVGYGEYDPTSDTWHEPEPPPLEAPQSQDTQALHANGERIYAVAADVRDVVQVAIRSGGGPWERAEELGPRSGRFPDGDRLTTPMLAKLTVATDAGLLAVSSSSDTIPAALLEPDTGTWTDLPVPDIASCESYPPPLAIPHGAVIFNYCGPSAFFDVEQRTFTALDLPTFPSGSPTSTVWTGRSLLTYATACCYGGGLSTPQMGSWERTLPTVPWPGRHPSLPPV